MVFPVQGAEKMAFNLYKDKNIPLSSSTNKSFADQTPETQKVILL